VLVFAIHFCLAHSPCASHCLHELVGVPYAVDTSHIVYINLHEHFPFLDGLGVQEVASNGTAIACHVEKREMTDHKKLLENEDTENTSTTNTRVREICDQDETEPLIEEDIALADLRETGNDLEVGPLIKQEPEPASSSDFELEEHALVFCMFVINLVGYLLWCAFKYDSKGTTNPSWTEVFG
jgi:hypothetical protein